jgi:hypothetical protein
MKKTIVLVSLLISVSLWAQIEVPIMDRIYLVPTPQQVTETGDLIPFPSTIGIQGLSLESTTDWRQSESFLSLLNSLHGVNILTDRDAEFTIRFETSESITHPEGYDLEISQEGVTIYSRTDTGRFYGMQTLYQILAFSYYGTDFLYGWNTPAEPDAAEKRYIPGLVIKDYPRYEHRGVMLDLGRSIFTVPHIKRIIRIMAQLKLNFLHLHLYDDEMCGFRFENMPLGKDNPYALTANDLREIVAYARSYHVTVMPELESWGHVKSIVYHYPELYGAPGMYAGASFAIGEATFDRLESMYDQVIACLEDTANIHVGLDEAIWTVAPGEEDKGYTPESFIGIIYDRIQQIAQKQGKQITMHLWADHGGRPLPDNLGPHVVIQPWMYRWSNREQIQEEVNLYGGKGKRPLMMGGGITARCYDGDFHATRLWSQNASDKPNALGTTICMWGTNDISGRLISLYAGSEYIWSPETPSFYENDPHAEQLRTYFNRGMRRWRILFPDAAPEAMNRDRGPQVFLGRYVWPPRTGEPVSPVFDYTPGLDLKTADSPEN